MSPWEYIDLERWPVEITTDHIQRLIGNVEHGFPRAAQPYVVWFYNYWTHFLDEGAPLLIWLFFAYSYLTNDGRSVLNRLMSRQMRRRAVRVDSRPGTRGHLKQVIEHLTPSGTAQGTARGRGCFAGDQIAGQEPGNDATNAGH